MGLKEATLCIARLDGLNAAKLWGETSAMIEHPDCLPSGCGTSLHRRTRFRKV